MLEKQIEAYLVKRVREHGGVAYKFVSPAHRGVADRLVVLPRGVVWFVELKTAGGKLSPLQQIFADEMARLGQNYVCLWSKEDVDQWIKEIRK
jgi:streptogramin lyase